VLASTAREGETETSNALAEATFPSRSLSASYFAIDVASFDGGKKGKKTFSGSSATCVLAVIDLDRHLLRMVFLFAPTSILISSSVTFDKRVHNTSTRRLSTSGRKA